MLSCMVALPAQLSPPLCFAHSPVMLRCNGTSAKIPYITPTNHHKTTFEPITTTIATSGLCLVKSSLPTTSIFWCIRISLPQLPSKNYRNLPPTIRVRLLPLGAYPLPSDDNPVLWPPLQLTIGHTTPLLCVTFHYVVCWDLGIGLQAIPFPLRSGGRRRTYMW